VDLPQCSRNCALTLATNPDVLKEIIGVSSCPPTA
jgi:hypothetical protein